MRKGTKQTNVKRINVNTERYFLDTFPLPESVVGAVLEKEGDSGAVERLLSLLSPSLYCSLWNYGKFLFSTPGEALNANAVGDSGLSATQQT